MPFVRITISGPTLDDLTMQRLAGEATRLMADVLGKRRDLTSVLVEKAGSGFWTVGGMRRDVAAHMEAVVTAGTNSTEEKARFLECANAALRSALVGLDVATYVVVREVPGDDWGYDGRTQASRRKAASPI